MKKAWFCLLLAVCCVALAACGNAPGPAPTPTLEPTPEVIPVTPAPEETIPELTPEPTPEVVPATPTPVPETVIEQAFYAIQNSNGQYLVQGASSQLLLSTQGSHFWWVQHGDSAYYIVCPTDVLNIAEGNYTEGASVIPFPSDTATPNEKWQFYTEDGQRFQIVSIENTDLAVVPGESGLVLRNRSGAGDNSFWTLTKEDGSAADVRVENNLLTAEPGSYALRNGNGQYLSFQERNGTESAHLALSGQPALWYVEKSDDNFVIRHDQTHVRAINIARGLYENGTSVIHYPYSGGNNEKWIFIPVGNDMYQIAAAENKNLVLVPEENGCVLREISQAGTSSYWKLIKLS